MVRRKTKVLAKRALRHIRPKHIIKMRRAGNVIQDFADKVGLVYFGFVDQRSDEHRLIRGHTVSETHQDNHYCIGTVRGYDAMLSLRNDVVRMLDGSDKRCRWVIVAIDLHSKVDVPDCYIGHKDREPVYAAAHRRLHPLALRGVELYPQEFTNQYVVHGTASNALLIQDIVTPQVAQVIAGHFAGASVEIEDNTVIMYVTTEHPTEKMIETALSNGLWLSELIDAQVTASQNKKEA